MQAEAEAPTDTAAVRAMGITKVYGQGGGAVTALDDVSVGFGAGMFTAVMGPSGSGKSTLPAANPHRRRERPAAPGAGGA
jgi:putative ABC transport system ATP-binding protein